MKRLIAFLLALLLALSCVSALAADYTVDEKFYRQMLQNGTKATLTFSATGSSTEMDDEVWNLICALAPRLTVELNHCVNRGEGQGKAVVFLDGEEKIHLDALYNKDLTGIKLDWLSPDWYVAPAGWDWGQMALPLVTGSKNDLPPLWHLILEAQSATDEWKKKAEPKLQAYQTKLGIWVNGFASSVMGEKDGIMYSELNCLVQSQAVKAEIKQLLVDFYGDQELLELLREISTAEEAAAYLDPALQNVIFEWIDRMPLEGAVEIIRRYDSMGNPLLDSISMPFGESQLLSRLTLSVSADAAGQCHRYQGQRRDGSGFDFSYIQAGKMNFSGELKVTLPADENDFTVGPEEENRTRGFAYYFTWEEAEETYSLATDLCQRQMNGTLDIEPLEGTDLPAQTVVLNVLFSSRSEKRSPSDLTAHLTWINQETDASVSVDATARTTAVWAVDHVEDLEKPCRLDQMTTAERSDLLNQWLQNRKR